MKKYPFFIIIDDGAFPDAGKQGKRRPVGMDTYESILKLAKEFRMRIPICLTMKFLDRKNLSGCGESIGYANDLVEFLKDNEEHIEIGYHGLVHSHEGHIGEFFCLDSNTTVSEEIQRERIVKSAEIFKDWGLAFPSLFVPPFHAWERGVTDRLASEFGVKYLVSFKRIHYDDHLYSWDDSEYLDFVEREELGIYNSDIEIREVSIETVSKHMIPRTLLNNIRLRRTLCNPIIHSYMTHIGNFLPGNYGFWRNVFMMAINNPRIEIAKDNARALEMCRNG
ncbi:MAG TPA: hypothetical protein DET40_11335 [Lentisphaeria bacterium]|nr:MAG: hypothetical protein A2X45_19855 [Lentisphaerae bacterium GWF2_50_93]HCE44132.1 hypothetical protein [Lentisphaeria bacterium]